MGLRQRVCVKIVKVIDSSSLAKFVLKEANWQQVREILAEGCVSVELSIKEVANSIRKRKAQGKLSSAKSEQLMANFVKHRMFELSEQPELYVGAFGIALKTGQTVYDSLYIELARKKGAVLVTSDQSQARAAESLGLKAYLIA